MTRPYRLKQRAERQDQTRQKIVDAAIALHQTKGPAATSMADIAAKAKVGRVTVYRHFPDETALTRACSGQYFSENPLPDPTAWLAIADARTRLRHGLRESYAFHRRTEAMIGRVLVDARDHPVMAPYHEHWQRTVEVLAAPFRAKGQARKLLDAALAVAVSFDTWRTLVRDRGLTDDQAIAAMLRLTCDCDEGGT